MFVVWTFSSSHKDVHRKVSTLARSSCELLLARDCHQHYLLRFPRIRRMFIHRLLYEEPVLPSGWLYHWAIPPYSLFHHPHFQQHLTIFSIHCQLKTAVTASFSNIHHHHNNIPVRNLSLLFHNLNMLHSFSFCFVLVDGGRLELPARSYQDRVLIQLNYPSTFVNKKAPWPFG